MVSFSKLASFGRLGNQLFQIAATYGLAIKNSDISKFYKWEYSNFFKNPIDQSLSISEITSSYSEPFFHFKDIPYRRGLDLIGYFQSEKYFSHCKNDIRNIFEFKDSLSKEEDFEFLNEACSVHVRRTDYLSLSDYHPFPGLEYYQRAMDHMRGLGINKFIFFSDDIEWCKNNFGFRGSIEYSEGNTNIRDLYLMSKCRHNIIANSSFSWWGAWLNKNPEKTIIAPSLWFGSAKKGTITEDLYCDGWIKM
jgi:hypothetical protein